MCKDCAAELGAPVPVTAALRRAREAVAAIYEQDWGGSGGPLHVQLDDTNLDDDFFTEGSRHWVVEAWGEWYADHPDSGLALSLAAFDLLAELTVAERATVVEYPEHFVDGQPRACFLCGARAIRNARGELVTWAASDMQQAGCAHETIDGEN